MMLLMNWSDPRWRHPDIRFAVVVGGGGVGTMWDESFDDKGEADIN